MCKFQEYFSKKLIQISAKETEENLGDRSKYIGASDIGGCLRKAYLGKTTKTEYDTATLLRFKRGHVAEQIVEDILKGLPYEAQCEATGELMGFPLKAHVDFLVKFKPEIICIEVKTVSHPLDEPYLAWLDQLQLQMGLVKANNQDMSVRGYIIAIDLNSGWIGTFSAEFNQVLYDAALKRAGKLIDALRTGKEPEAEEQFYCSLCPHKSGCPALEKGKKIELPDDVKAMVKEVKSLSDSEKKAKELKAQIKAFMEACEAKTGIADELTVSYQSRAGVKTLDTEALATRYPEIDFSPFYKQGEGFSYVMVR